MNPVATELLASYHALEAARPARPAGPTVNETRRSIHRSAHYLGGPLLLVTSANPSLSEHELEGQIHPNLGRLIQPRHVSSIEETVVPWAADNDCFQGLKIPAFERMLDRIQPLSSSCLFVTVPDVVGDAHATAIQFEKWSSAVERRGLPVALVMQDGIEHLSSWLEKTWHRLDAVFMGGTTEWKESENARIYADLARRDGKWVHWGRVNTKRRYDLCVADHGDSFDGSKFPRFRKTYLDGGLSWCRETGLDQWWRKSVVGGRTGRELLDAKLELAGATS